MSSTDHVASTSLSPAEMNHGLALASRGDALTSYLDDALRKRFSDVRLIDPDLTAAQRYRVAALTVRPTRSRWVERFYKSNYASRLRSANATRILNQLPQKPDAVLQVHALFQLTDSPTALYVDCTHAQSAHLWPAWNPLSGRALSEWYRREAKIYASAKHIFAFCEPTRDSLVSDYGVDPDKVTITGAGVNFQQLPDVDVTEPKPLGAPTILFIGNDFVRKGGPELLDAFQQVRAVIPDARLQLIGVDPLIAQQPGVEVLGRIDDRDRIAAHYAQANVFVVPSIFDPFPLVALEAMSFGLPVVATRQMGTPEMISDGVTGRLVEPRDVDGLAGALLQLLLQPELARKLGAAARHDIEDRFTWDAVVERMAPQLDRLLAGTNA